jgi:hypothetical protein
MMYMLQGFLQAATDVSEDHPVVITKFIEGAEEIDVDAISNKVCVTFVCVCVYVVCDVVYASLMCVCVCAMSATRCVSHSCECVCVFYICNAHIHV